MSPTRFTPGPWTVLDGSSGLLIEQRVRLVDFDNGVRPLHVAFIATSLTPSPRAEANAHLIAAAPDLLDALKELEATFRGTSDIARLVQRITRAAIAKAEGRA